MPHLDTRPLPYEDVGIQRIKSHHAIAELLFPDTAKFLATFNDQSPASISVWRDHLERFGHRSAFFGAAYCHYYGILPEDYKVLCHHLNLSNTELFGPGEDEHAEKLRWYKFSSLLPEKIPLDPAGTRCIRPFICEFRDVPLELCRIAMRRSDRGNPGVFAMYLPPEEMREVVRDAKNAPAVPHVLGAFAYIRYYRKEGTIEVAEIQNDFIERLTTRPLKERYKHWEELLLLSFESHLNTLYESAVSSYKSAYEHGVGELDLAEDDLSYLCSLQAQRLLQEHREEAKKELAGERVIAIPLPPVIRSRWIKPVDQRELEAQILKKPTADVERSSFASGLADQIYGVIPERVGYAMGLAPHPNFIELDNCGGQVQQLISLIKVPSEGQVDPFLREALEIIHERLTEVAHSTKCELSQRCSDSFPTDLFRAPDWDGYPIAFPVHHGIRSKSHLWRGLPGMTIAPIEPSTISSIPGITPEIAVTCEKYMSSPFLAPVTDVHQPEYSFFSLGRSHGLPGDWWNLSRVSPAGMWLQSMAISDQKRHPSVRIYSNYSSEQRSFLPCVTVGSKGAGLTEHEVGDYFLHQDVKQGGTTYPIVLPKRRSDGDVAVPSHAYWGGMLLEHAEAEYRNTAGLVFLFDYLGQNPLERVAYPLNVGLLHAIPYVEPKGLSWMLGHEYAARVLDAHSESKKDQPGVFVSVSRSDVRISQVVNRIFTRTEASADNIVECQNEILTALRYLFEVNGVAFVDVRGSFPIGCSKLGQSEIGPREYQLYVNEVVERNKKSAYQLFQRLSRRLLSSVGFVHGAGGHFGGGFNGQSGSVGGGAVAIRNVDCCGALHDLDMDVFIPWVSPELRTSVDEVKVSQAFDLVFLKDTLYWLESLLLGRKVSEGESMHMLTILNPFNRCTYFGKHSIECQSPAGIFGPNRANERLQQLDLFDLGHSKISGDRGIDYSPWKLTMQERNFYRAAYSRGVAFSRRKGTGKRDAKRDSYLMRLR